MSLSPVSCSSILLVHSSRLEELIDGLTALVQYAAQLLAGPHQAQPSHHAIWPSSCFLLCFPLSCHSPALYQSGFASHPSLDLSSPCPVTLSSISHHFPVTSSLPHLSPSSRLFLSILSPLHPFLSHLLPLGSDEGVRSVVINERLDWDSVSVCACFGEKVHLLFFCKLKQAGTHADWCMFGCICVCVC